MPLTISAIVILSLSSNSITNSPAPGPDTPKISSSIHQATMLSVRENQFHDPATNMPSWLVQLEDANDLERPENIDRHIDTVLAETIGQKRTTQRYQHALIGFAAFMTVQEASALRDDPRVRRVEPDVMVSGNAARPTGEVDEDPNIPAPWGLRRISDPDGLAPDYDPCGADGSGVTVAVIDSGITPDHSEFGDRIVDAVNFYTNADSPIDQHGHGTHVASTIAGATIGVAPAADIVALRALGPTNSGPVSALVAALNWLANPFNIQNPAAVNMSVGSNGLGNQDTIYFLALSAVANRGFPIISSAGNFSYPSLWSTPANSADTMSVGAMDVLDQVAVFSNNGPVVDLWAPGVHVLAADWQHPNGGLKLDSGTSMASPMVTGVMALHLQRYPADPVANSSGGEKYEAMRKRLGVIAATVEGRLREQDNPNVLAVGGNGVFAGATNRLLQACPSNTFRGCDAPLNWTGTNASIILGDGIAPLPPGFTCSQTIVHPSGTVALEVNVPSVLPTLGDNGSITGLAADIGVTDLATGELVWTCGSSWLGQSAISRTINRTIIATGPEGLRIDWVSIDDDVSGGYGYAMTANAIGVLAGDLDGDGVVGGKDLGVLLTQWGTCQPEHCSADLNGDGKVDSADLGLLLAAWGTLEEHPLPGFIRDCNGSLAPAAWLGDRQLDNNSRRFALSPLADPDDITTVDLDCEELQWDAPTVGFSISPSDPRTGAAGLADGTCDTMTFAEATAAGATFFGHGTNCTQPIPSIDSSAFYDGGSLAYGQFSDTVDVAAVTLSNPPAIIRQPIDEEIRSISRLSVAGALRAVASSNTNVGSGRSGHGLASFTTDFLITMTFRDGSAPLSVVRTPMVGGITNSSPQGLVQNMVVENVHLDDGREIESVSVRVNFNGPGIPSDSWVLLAGNSIDDTEPSSGALVSPNGGQSWYPMLAADGRRVQLVLSIEP